ncbi:MAG: bifunctional demethylmenaquinone methyltransferase/2-methoxy-6-polyprenyl-1,4-benzoquinol methylase UbiE [Bryobacter sp.]|nr:bifunctional demethylmenaquinone methyltransferase/2-methoxy-6-polyprenyl-1,4-benzoquinol methylase UbiE [Bryobacter sp.]
MSAPHGTTPPGAASEQQAARWVRDMFAQVAPRYDLLNHLLSLNIDRSWRRRTVARLDADLARPDARVLDLACGTGDLLAALQQQSAAAVYGSDFCHPMLVAARPKTPRSPLFEADALRLPLRDDTFDVITVAFGFRNFANYRNGLVELRRVLRPGGTLAILEFTTPPNRLFAAFYRWYSTRVLPRIGALISGSRDAYTYLPESVRKFPDAVQLESAMREAGFSEARFEYMTLGVVALHQARK